MHFVFPTSSVASYTQLERLPNLAVVHVASRRRINQISMVDFWNVTHAGRKLLTVTPKTHIKMIELFESAVFSHKSEDSIVFFF